VSAHIARGINPVNNEVPYKLLRKLVEKADVVFDIGANVGIISVLISKAMKDGSSIYSFEPLPSTCRVLVDNARVQKGNATVVPFNLAMSNAVGDVYFTNKEDPTENNILHEPQVGSVLVKSTTVDVFCAEHKVIPQVIKVDVEGAEYFVLEGMIKTLQQNDCVVLMEIHDGMLQEFGVNEQQFATLLGQTGYHLYNDKGDELPYNKVFSSSCIVLSKKPLDRAVFAVS
jgi:FkbM family methyltransferase